MGLIQPTLRAALCHELGNGKGQTRRGEGQKKTINIVGGGEMTHTLIAENVAEGDLVDGADDFHEDAGNRQNRCAAKEILLFVGHK